MDMVELGMDTAWCLACSKQLDNPKSTYCSDVCRHQDSLPLDNALDVAEITWPSSMASHPTEANGDRPTVQPYGPLEEVLTGNQFRGRRAYSFPAHQTQEAPLLPGSRRQTQTQETLQFVRKSHRVSATLSHNVSPHLGPVVASRASKGFGKLSKTTGNNTPLVPDSVFCSNSESSDNECVGQSPRNVARRMSSKSTRGDYLSETIRLPRAPVPRRFSVNLMMEPAPPRARPALEPAHTLPIAHKPSSPVARMAATSAGSRSREDIVSWLNEVKCLPNQADGDTDLSFNRHDTITPTQERVEWVGENGLSTTPQGRFGSALAGLSTIRGFSAVRAFASAAGSNPPTTTVPAAIAAAKNPEMPSTIQATPSQAEVSRVAVTAVSTEHDDSGYVMSHVGATPTLSTISLSEVVDPLTDGGENVDFFSDEQSANGDYSYVQRRLSAAITGPNAPNAPKSGDESAKLADPPKASSAIRPLTNTARAIWSFSNYLRSFAPLSISSVAPSPRKAESPISPTSSAPAKPPSPRAYTSPASILHDQPKDISIAPMPTAHQPPPPEPESPVKEMVRSLPMNIVHPAGMQNVALERRVQREQEAEMGMDAHWSPSKSRSRARGSAKGSRVRAASPSRSGSRGRSRGRRSRAREMSKVRGSHSRHGRKVSYDADASGEDEPEDDDDARGRSRRPRGLRMESMEDDRRGRDRTVKA